MNLTNNFSGKIDAEALQNIANAVLTIRGNLPKLVTLTAEQRQSMPKMGDKTIAFVNKALGYAKQNLETIPAYLSFDEFTTDVEGVNALFQVKAQLDKLVEEIDDTMMTAGSEAYIAALVFYSAVKTAIQAGETGLKSIYDDMAQRFPAKNIKSKNIEK